MIAYPNPADNQLNVFSEKPFHELLLKIVDVKGKQTSGKSIQTDRQHVLIDVSEFSNGMYLLMLHDEGVLSTRKFFIER